jgi:putative membrane protein
MMNDMGGLGWWGPGMGGVFMILWWGLIVVGIVALVKWLSSSSWGSGSREKMPLDTLKERYARGELNSQEYERARRDLERL